MREAASDVCSIAHERVATKQAAGKAAAARVSTLIWQIRAPSAVLLALRICESYSTRLAPCIRGHLVRNAAHEGFRISLLSPRSGSKLLFEAMREAAHLLAIRLDDHVRDFAIERIASRVELLHACERIRSLEQRPMLAVAGALPQRGGRCVEVEHRPTLLEPLAVRWTQHHPAASGKHDIVLDDEVGEDGCFAVAKARLALQL